MKVFVLFRMSWPSSSPPTRPTSEVFGVHAHLDNIRAFKAYLAPLRKIDSVVYAKRPSTAPGPCSPIYRATPTGSPSPIAA